MSVETLRVAPELTLRPPDGEPITVRNVRARLAHEGEQLTEVWLLCELDPESWRRVDQAELFHLEAEVRGPSFAGPVEPEANVHLEARLARDHVTALALLCDNEWEVLAQIFGARLVPRLHETESWYALHVTRQVGPVKAGFRTTWADAAEVPPVRRG